MHPSSILRARGVLKRSSYYESDYTQSAALIRARRPYLFKNLVTGASLMTIAISIFVYTLHAVGQEKFEDVIVPDAPRESQSQTGGSTSAASKSQRS